MCCTVFICFLFQTGSTSKRHQMTMDSVLIEILLASLLSHPVSFLFTLDLVTQTKNNPNIHFRVHVKIAA